jgi:hypothetical protein
MLIYKNVGRTTIFIGALKDINGCPFKLAVGSSVDLHSHHWRRADVDRVKKILARYVANKEMTVSSTLPAKVTWSSRKRATKDVGQE